MFAHESYRPERLATLRQLAYGASPMPDAILDRLLSELPDLELIQGYGMTERARPRSASCCPRTMRPGAPRLRSVGQPGHGCHRSRSSDEDGNEVPTRRGRRGLRPGRQLDAGVLEQAGGDRGSASGRLVPHRRCRLLDEDGYLFLVDRVKDMIVTGGENVYSAEVESAITTHPGCRPGRRHRRPPRARGARRSTPVVVRRARDRASRPRSSSTHARGGDRRLQGPEVRRLPRRPPPALRRDEGA